MLERNEFLLGKEAVTFLKKSNQKTFEFIESRGLQGLGLRESGVFWFPRRGVFFCKKRASFLH
jgi:hypothetical protein